MNKLGKYDEICCKCGKIIRGATRESVGQNDDMSNNFCKIVYINGIGYERWQHRKCQI